MIIKIIILLFFCSCASRELTRDEWLAIGQKKYKNLKKEEIIKAAEKLLTLMDGSDVSFSHSSNGFTAFRKWSVYAVLAAEIGTDFWIFQVEEKDNDLVATLQLSTSSGRINGYVTSHQSGTITTPSIGKPIQGTATYDTFWNRLDYLVGQSKQWMDCNLAKEKIERKETWGELDKICDSILLKDELPENLSDIELDRLFKNQPSKRLFYIKTHRPHEYQEARKKYEPKY